MNSHQQNKQETAMRWVLYHSIDVLNVRSICRALTACQRQCLSKAFQRHHIIVPLKGLAFAGVRFQRFSSSANLSFEMF